MGNFNPRSHEESDTIGYGFERIPIDFNPRSHEESDKDFFHKVVKIEKISIHALTKRATLADDYYKGLQPISIHALTKRATL